MTTPVIIEHEYELPPFDPPEEFWRFFMVWNLFADLIEKDAEIRIMNVSTETAHAMIIGDRMEIFEQNAGATGRMAMVKITEIKRWTRVSLGDEAKEFSDQWFDENRRIELDLEFAIDKSGDKSYINWLNTELQQMKERDNDKSRNEHREAKSVRQQSHQQG